MTDRNINERIPRQNLYGCTRRCNNRPRRDSIMRLRGEIKPSHILGGPFSQFESERRPGCSPVEIYAVVRRFVFVEGRSRRETAEVFGLSRDTISKMCPYSARPGYVRSKPPEPPKLGPLVPIIDSLLDADKAIPPKQNHTARRIF